jgi:hypothetical protein
MRQRFRALGPLQAAVHRRPGQRHWRLRSAASRLGEQASGPVCLWVSGFVKDSVVCIGTRIRSRRVGLRVAAGACLSALTALSGLLLPAALAAQRDEVDAAPPPGLLDRARASARSATEWLARSVDGWFGDAGAAQAGQFSDGRLDLGLHKRQGQAADIDLRFDARLRLPSARRQTYLFIGRDDPVEVARDRPQTITDQQNVRRDTAVERSWLAGLGVALHEGIDLRLGLRAGLKPYVQARYERPLALAPAHALTLRETVFWTRTDRLGSTTALAYDWAMAPALSLRWLTVGTITEVSRNFEWASTVGLYRLLGAQRRLSLELVVSGTGTRGTGRGLSDHGALVKWEQPIHEDWLLIEGLAGHFWPRYEAGSPRGRAWALGATLKMHF